jgi:hypothetical protein
MTVDSLSELQYVTLYCWFGHLSPQLKAQATQAAQMSAATVKSALDAGLAAWSSYDKDGVRSNTDWHEPRAALAEFWCSIKCSHVVHHCSGPPGGQPPRQRSCSACAGVLSTARCTH